MRVWSTYTAGRLCAVTTRPLCLFLANNYLSAQTAQSLAVAFLASALALAGVAGDPHRRFYASLFADGPRANGLSFYLYVMSLLLLMSAGGVLVFGMSLHFTGSVAIAVAGTLYYASEKIADEVLRLRLFEGEFTRWGRATAARSTLQLTALSILLGFGGMAAPDWLAITLLACGSLLVFVPQLPTEMFRNLRVRRFVTFRRLVPRAARSLRSNWVLWANAVLGGAIAYLDRLVALVLDKAMLPLFMLVVMCFSVVQMAVDFYYVSQHRRDFLEQRITLSGAFRSPQFLKSFGAGLVIAAIATAVLLMLSHNGADFPLVYVLVIACLQVALALISVPQQILYWKQHLHSMFRIDLAFWALFACTAGISTWLRLPVSQVFGLVVACALIRLALYTAVAAPAHRKR